MERSKKVLLINGSPRENGNTRMALGEVAKTLQDEGVATAIVNIGKAAMQGCVACGWCGRMGRCTYHDDVYEQVRRHMVDGIDGLVVGSPVYYGGPNGSLCALMDRVCYSLNRYMKFRPAASVVVCRRGGATAAFDRLNKYFTMLDMPLVSSQYWNIVYGHNAGEAACDEEGMQTMRTLGRNMAWMVRRLDLDVEAPPRLERPTWTSFVRPQI